MSIISATGTRQDSEKKSYVKSLTRSASDTAQEVLLGNSELVSGIDYDEIAITYPTTASEVFTYKLAAATIKTITITYTDDTKGNLTSVIIS
jgi:hypothetical protein